MSVIFLFIDGVGLGPSHEHNPFFLSEYKGFTSMSGGQPFLKGFEPIKESDHTFIPVDARLDVEGLPQSGTGQTALFSGENASKAIGKHFGPFPHSGIRHLLNKHSLFYKVQELNRRCSFVNAYPDIFFQKVSRKNRWTCTTLMTKNAGIPLNTTKDVKLEKALTAELTQKAWRNKLQINVPEITPDTAANRLIKQSQKYDLVLHEYYLTDKAGHSQSHQNAKQYLRTYSSFLHTLIRNKPEETTIILSSDHGNIEDLSTKTHTLNKVPLFAYGPGAGAISEAKSITDVTPGIVDILKEG
jgi:hypothetical protein